VDRLVIVGVIVVVLVVAAIVIRRRAASPKSIPTRIDPVQLGLDAQYGDTAVVAFSGPLCHACQEWGKELTAAGIPYRRVDVLHESHLAHTYAIKSTPVILIVKRSNGTVLESYTEEPSAESVARVRSLVLV
jgi:hypothetical protein